MFYRRHPQILKCQHALSTPHHPPPHSPQVIFLFILRTAPGLPPGRLLTPYPRNHFCNATKIRLALNLHLSGTFPWRNPANSPLVILMFYWKVKWIISNEISKCHFRQLIAQNYSFQVRGDKTRGPGPLNGLSAEVSPRLGINGLTLIRPDK